MGSQHPVEQGLELGPIHPWLPGHMKLGLGLWGDEITSVDLEFGFCTKGIIEYSLGKRTEKKEEEIVLVVCLVISSHV